MTTPIRSIDGGVFFGMDATNGLGNAGDACFDRLERFDVDAVLAVPFRAGRFDIFEGNRELLAAAEADPRIVPVPAINPASLDLEGTYLDELTASGVRAVGLFPNLFFGAWNWSTYSVERFVRAAGRRGLVVQIGLQNADELGEVVRHLSGTGTNILVRWLAGSGYRLTADMVAAGRDCNNLFFDVGTTTQSGGVDFLVSRLGADRLFVASNAPLSLEGCAHFLVSATRLDARDRAMIRCGTVGRLLGLEIDDAPEGEVSSWRDLVERPKVDTHWHTSGWNIVEPRIDIKSMREDFDRFNYRLVATSSIRALCDDLSVGNAETRDFCDADPRVRGYVVVNPLQIDASIAEIDTYAGDPRFVGVKTIQDFYGLSLADPQYAPILEYARERDLTVMAHLDGMATVAERYPELRFIAAHGTWRPSEYSSLPNVYVDIATSSPLRRHVDLELVVKSVGPDRVIFSTDGQLMSPAWTLGKLASTDLDAGLLEKIFCRNAFNALPRLRATQAVPNDPVEPVDN